MAYFLDTVIPDNAVFLFFSKAEQFGLFGTMTPVKGYVNRKTGKPVAPYTGLRRRKLSHPVSGNLFGHAADEAASSHIQTEKVKKPRKPAAPSPEKLDAFKAKIAHVVAHAKVDAQHAPKQGEVHKKLYLAKLESIKGIPADLLDEAKQNVEGLFKPKTLTAEPLKGQSTGGDGGNGNGGGKGNGGSGGSGSGDGEPPKDSNAFVASSSGSIDFGRIAGNAAIAIKQPEGPIRLQIGFHDDATGRGFGKVHIDRDLRATELAQNGYSSTEALIEDVAQHFTAIYEGKNNSFILVKENGKAKIAFVSVKRDKDGVFYSVGSGLISRTDYLKKKSRLWERAQSNQPKPPSAISGQQPGSISTLPPPAPEGKAAPEGKGKKEPWEMTLAELNATGRIIHDTKTKSSRVWEQKNPDIASNATEHRRQVISALAAGKPVPPEVLADYPDLKDIKPKAKAAAIEPPKGSGNGGGNGNGGSGDKPPRRFKVTAERKGKEVKFTVEDAFFDWLQVKPYAIWADIDRLHLKHPDHFASAEAVQQHIQDVLAGAEIAMPATHVEYTLLVALRDHEDHQAATIEFVLRGGKYRVRNAQKMPQTQLDVKLDRAGVEARLRRGKRNPTVPPRNPTTPGISAGSPVPPSDGPPTKPEFTLPPPAPQSKAAPAPAEPQNANARHTLPLKSVLAEWKPRFRDSTPPRYRRVPKDMLPKVYHVSGDLDMISLQASVTFMGDPDKNRDKARQILDAVKAAKEAGYEQKRVDIGGGNTALIFVKDEHVLTPAGVAGLRSDVFARPDLDDNAGYDAMAKNQTAVATAFARWMKTLPASTLDSFSALSAKISGTAIGQWAKIRRDQHGQPVLDVFGENGNVRARLTTGGMGSAGNPLYIQGANKDVKALLHHVIALANELKNSPPPTNEREWGRLTDRAEKKAAEAYKSGESLTDALREQSGRSDKRRASGFV